MAKFRVYTYDLWGNEEEGYSVNDTYETNEVVDIPDDISDKELIQLLKDKGVIKNNIEDDLIDIGGDDQFITFDYDGRPEFEMRLEDEDEEEPEED